MNNPWREIDLKAYENHMSLNSVFQLQTLNKMMKDQFYSYPVTSVMILGVAGGNGLEHIDRRVIDKVYGLDINKDYLDACVNRYPELKGIEIHYQMEEAVLVDIMEQIGYKKVMQIGRDLPNGKKLVRIDFACLAGLIRVC